MMGNIMEEGLFLGEMNGVLGMCALSMVMIVAGAG
jgi:hypothetical protein